MLQVDVILRFLSKPLIHSCSKLLQLYGANSTPSTRKLRQHSLAIEVNDKNKESDIDGRELKKDPELSEFECSTMIAIGDGT